MVILKVSHSKLFALCFGLLAFAASCKSKKELKPIVDAVPPAKAVQPAADTFFDHTFSMLQLQQLQFNQFSMRCKVDYDDGSFRQDFTANIRIRKDSLIWLSLTGLFGIEGARMVIRQDSVFLMNKLTREYLARPASYLQQIIPLSSGYDALQNLLLGQMVNVEPSERRIFEADSFLVVNFQNQKLRQTATLHRQNYTALELLLADQQLKQDLKITFGDYRDLSGKAFAFQRFIEVNRGAQKMKLNMEVQRYTINEPLTFPFEVNDSYKRN